MRARSRSLAAFTAALALAPAAVGGAQRPAAQAAIPPNLDIRATTPAPIAPPSPEVQAALDALHAELGPDIDARFDRRGTPRTIAARTRPLSRPDVDPPGAALRFISRHHRVVGLARGDLASLVLSRQARRRNDGLVHLDFRQETRGLRVFGTGVRVHLTAAGEIVRVSSTAVPVGIEPAPPAIGAAEAIEIAVSHTRPDLATVPRQLQGPRGQARESVFDRGAFKSDFVAALELFPIGDELRTAWHVVVEPPGLPQKYDVLVDATSGRLLYRRNRVLYAEGVGRVLQSDQAQARDPRATDEHPLGSAQPGTLDVAGGCPPIVNHVSRSLTAQFRDPGTVLFDTGRLEGNGTHVFRSVVGLFGAAGTAQPGGWDFDFEFGSAASAETHLFFVANFLHDFFYDLGFDEGAGNFQVDNFGRGGLGGDGLFVVSRADGRNNATFEPKPDGQSPIMSMFLWDGSGCWASDVDLDGVSDLDGAFDSDIIIHEFHHGVSTRLNPFFSGDEADAMGEGGSDFFAYSINGNTSLAEYAYPPTGIRQVNGRTYGSWYCLLGFFCEPHDNGEIWADVLWDLRERFRADVVNGSEPAAVHAAHLLYVDGLALSPASPTMLDMRDAMLQADRLRHPSGDPGGSSNGCRIWEVFTLRGMGAGALDTADTGTNTVVENFTMPATCPVLPPPATVTIAATDAAASEAGGNDGTFTVTRTGDTARPLTVYLGAPSGSAVEGGDYQTLPANVTIAAGAATVAVTLVPLDDALVEPNETVMLALLSGPGYRLGTPASATITIVSDDVAPDLVVSAFTGPSATGAGVAISVAETTKNQGNGAVGATLTRYYLSLNTSIDAADTPLGTREVPALAAGASSSAAITLTIPGDTATGTYYVIAQADADDAASENFEGNNLRFLVLRVGPDLVMSALTVPTITAAGGTISITDTTKNQGAGEAGASVTAFHLSTDSAVDAADVLLGSRPVPVLAAGLTHSATASVTIPPGTGTGTWYVIARADNGDGVPETLETNNVTVRQLRVGPDLVVSAITGPAVGGAGSAITVNDTTKNQGGAAAGGAVTRFYLSVDPVLGAGDVALGSRNVNPLAGGASSAGATTMTIPAGTTTGAYNILAQADADEANVETSETNNGNRLSVRIGPDLIVSSVVVPATMAAGASVNVTNTIKNQGGSAADSCSARLLLSTNPSVDGSDVLLGTRVVPALAAGATSAVTTTVTIPPDTAAGSYYLLVQADGLSEVVETIETNNTYSSSVRVGPDLRVATGSVPSKVTPGMPFPVTDSTMNSGGAPAAASTTRYYLSTNTLFDAGDMLLGGRDVPALAAGATSTATSSLTVPAGTTKAQYYLVIVADADGGIAEVYENNNTLVLVVAVN